MNNTTVQDTQLRRFLPNMKLMLDCRALVRLLSQSQDDAPPLAVRARMRLHLVTCQSCRNVDEQMRFIRTAMEELQINPPGNSPAAEQPP